MDLETTMRQGGSVVVRYTGCEMELLRNCKGPDNYKYVPGTRQDERVIMRNADELYAKMPIGAVDLEASVAGGNELSVSLSVVGKYMGPSGAVQVGDLKGADCSGATHVIVGLSTGSFEMASAASSSAGAGVGVAGGRTSKETRVLRRGGSTQACDRATSRDTEPPEGCGAFLRLELAKVECPSSLTYVEGKGCVNRWAADESATLSGRGESVDSPLANMMVEASYAVLGRLQGARPDPKYSVSFKQDEEESKAIVAKAALGPNPALRLVVSSVRGTAPTADGRAVIDVEALFHVFPPGKVRWGGLDVSREEASGDRDASGLASFGETPPAWLAAHDGVVQAFKNENCVIAPAVTAAELAAVPLTSDQRKDLEELVDGYVFDTKGCAEARLARGPWSVDETRIYSVFSNGKTGFVLFAVAILRRDKIELYDAKVSFIGD